MELDVTSDQEFLVATTRKFLEDKVDVTTLRRLRHDERGYDDAHWRRGCEFGWTSLLVGEANALPADRAASAIVPAECDTQSSLPAGTTWSTRAGGVVANVLSSLS